MLLVAIKLLLVSSKDGAPKPVGSSELVVSHHMYLEVHALYMQMY